MDITRYALPPGAHMTLSNSAIAYAQLELTDNVINFASSLSSVEITVQELILHGKNTIDLTSLAPNPQKPSTPPGKIQAPNTGQVPREGDGGSGGVQGNKGADGVALKLSIQQVIADDGSMWIQTDGKSGGSGGDAGAGAKGSSGPRNGFRNPNGGSGGSGGTGGKGGPGGNTAKITLTVGPNTVSPTQATGTAPSVRPALADMPGTIVIAGAPGTGGQGGAGGSGGPGGEGFSGSGPFTHDSDSGAPGSGGASGAIGDAGNFVP